MQDTIKQRDPGIQTLARKYNALSAKVAKAIQKRRAPRNAIPPRPIPMKELFNLDVDDEIWQDVGLDETTDLEQPPLWLCDGAMRKGIQGILVRD